MKFMNFSFFAVSTREYLTGAFLRFPVSQIPRHNTHARADNVVRIRLPLPSGFSLAEAHSPRRCKIRERMRDKLGATRKCRGLKDGAAGQYRGMRRYHGH